MKRNNENEILIIFFSLEEKNFRTFLIDHKETNFHRLIKLKNHGELRKIFLFRVNNFRFISYNN